MPNRFNNRFNYFTPLKGKLAAGILCLVLLAGCKVGKNYQRNFTFDEATQNQLAANNTAAQDTVPLTQWRQLFTDTCLQRIIATTLAQNRDVLTAAARMEEARLQAGFIKANMYPNFGYNLQAGGGTAKTDALKVAGGLDGGKFAAQGVLNWEIDIWGKLRRANASAQAQFLATVENRRALEVSLIAQAAEFYFLLLDLDNRLKIAERTLEIRKESSRIISERYDKGWVSEVDKLQQIQQEKVVATVIPSFQRQIIVAQNSLRALMGMAPGPINRCTSLLEQTSPDIQAGVSSALLERRPDLRAAEQDLKAQFERIGIAEALRYPTFSLTGVLGFASPSLSTLLSNGFVANGFAGLVGPIFQFGQNKRRVLIETERAKQLQYQYEQTYLNALADVENALTQRRLFAEELKFRKEQKEAAEKALVLSRARYDYGYTTFLEVQIQESNLLDAELQESILIRSTLSAYVQLYRALGGGWQ